MDLTLKQQEEHKRLSDRHNTLKKIRAQLEARWQENCDIFAPHRSDILSEISNWSSVGNKIWDGTPQHALIIWVDGIQGYMISSAIRWFALSLADQRLIAFDEVKLWLQDVQDVLYTALADSNYYATMGEYLLDGGVVGTSSKFIHEDLAGGRIFFSVEHPKNVWLSENRHNEVNEFVRFYKLTAAEAVAEFGAKNVGPQCLLDARENPLKEIGFRWHCEPNTEYLPYRSDIKGKPFRSTHVQVDEPVICRQSGYYTMPGSFWRPRRRHGFAYGISPAECALYDGKALQVMSKTMMTAGQMAVDGPINAHEKLRGKIKWKPRAINYYTDKSDAPSAANTNVNYPIGADREDKLRESVNRWFSVSYFAMMQEVKGDINIPHVLELQAEKAALLGPMIERYTEDSSDEDLARVYDILGRSGRLPEPPAILMDATEGGVIKVEYEGPIAQARKSLYQNRAIRQTLQDLAAVEGVCPGSMDIVDCQELGRIIAEGNGFPQKAIRGKDLVAQIRQERAQQQAAQQQLMIAQTAADSASKLQGPMDPTSPLAGILKN